MNGSVNDRSKISPQNATEAAKRTVLATLLETNCGVQLQISNSCYLALFDRIGQAGFFLVRVNKKLSSANPSIVRG